MVVLAPLGPLNNIFQQVLCYFKANSELMLDRIWKTFPEEELFFGTLTSASCNQKSEKKSYIKAHKRVTAHNYPFLRYPSLLSASPLPLIEFLWITFSLSLLPF